MAWRVLALVTLSTVLSIAASAETVISWTPIQASQAVIAGTTATLHVQFSTTKAFDRLDLEVVPELAQFLQVWPTTLGPISPGQQQDITLLFSVPRGTKTGVIEGTVHL